MNKLGTMPEVGQNPSTDPAVLQEQVLAAVQAHNQQSTTQPQMTVEKFPGQVVELPSKGLLYPPDHPLAKGTIEMKYMTAKEEDILTTESYIKSGVVLDKLFESLILTPVDYKSILVGDKDALMIAARVYGYGELYNVKVKAPSGKEIEFELNLNDLKAKEIDQSLITPGSNQFTFKSPITQDEIVFKLLTIGDQQYMDEQKKKYKRPGSSDNTLTATLAQMIVSVNGNSDKTFINLYTKNMRALDARKLREYIAKVQPGIDMTVELEDPETGEPFRTQAPIGLDFFWPDVRV